MIFGHNGILNMMYLDIMKSLVSHRLHITSVNEENAASLKIKQLKIMEVDIP